MNLIIVRDEDYTKKDIVKLEGRRFKHIRKVHRAKKGDVLKIGELNGKIGTGTVLELGEDFVEIELNLTKKPPKPMPVKLILAMPRPKVFKRLLQMITTLGIKEIYLLGCWKVEKSFFDTPNLLKEKIEEQLILGLEQAKDTVLPKIVIKKLFKPFIEDELSKIIEETEALVAHPYLNKEDIVDPKKGLEWKTLVIGPEGGFIPYEVEKLEEIGFKRFSIGERILKVESAVPFILGRITS